MEAEKSLAMIDARFGSSGNERNGSLRAVELERKTNASAMRVASAEKSASIINGCN